MQSNIVDLIILYVYVTLEALSFVFCMVGNIAVIYVLITKKKLSRTSNMYILSTSIADFLIGFFVIPYGILQAFDHHPHEFLPCVSLTLFAAFSYGASLTSLMAVAIDRFLAICFPIFHYNHKNRITKWIILVSWMIPSTITLIHIFDKQLGAKFKNKCISSAIFRSNSSLLGGFYISFGCIIMILLYSIIYYKISKQEKRKLRLTLNTINETSSRAEIQCAKTIALIIVAYIVCWTPAAIRFFIVGFTKNDNFFQQNSYLHIFYLFSFFAAHVNSGINPVIYAYRITDVHDSINKVLSRTTQS